MIRLNQTATQLISLITAQNGATCVVSYSDKSATGYDGNTQVTAIASATTTTICSTPAASTIRDIDHISVRNTYAGSQSVTLQVSSSATLYPLVTITLAQGDTLEYTHGSGFRVLDANGNVKTSPFSGMTSAQLAGLITDETGSGALVFGTSPTLVTPALGTPASGTLDNCTTNTEVAGTNNTQLASTAHVYAERTNSATLTNKTLTGALVTATSADNDATLLVSDNKWVKSQIAQVVNPKAMSQGVALTASASVGAISVADNANIDFGTGNFTLNRKVYLADWTPSAETILVQKTDGTNGYKLAVQTGSTGILVVTINTTAYSSTVATGLTDGTGHEISAVITRETASVAGSVVFYVDGVALGASVAITAGAPTTVDNASLLYLGGTSTTRSAYTDYSSLLYNRALSASEVLSLYNNGVAESDKDGSQSELVVNGSFTTDTDWTKSVGWTIDTGTGELVASASAGTAAYQSSSAIVAGKAYWVTFTVTSFTTNGVQVLIGGSAGTKRTAVGTYSELIIAGSTNAYISMYAPSGGGFIGRIDNLSVVRVGTTLRLEPEGIQLGAWYDSSSNNLNASYPASGFSFLRQPARLSNKLPTPTAGTGTATLTIAQLLTGIVTDTHATGATATYTLPTATLMDAALPSMQIDDSFEWSLINLSAAAADTATVAAGTSHTIVGNAVVQSAHATTGALYGSSARFRTKKSAVNTYITYRIS